MSHHMALVGLGISKRSFIKGFQNFHINFPSTQTFEAKIISSDHISVDGPYNKDSPVKTSGSRGVYSKFHAHFWY
jgi:hypothetical protein